ncbi:terpenoid cyclases/Protein prenyltransferase [Clavulina sp. PMI_390]|nr:terpenoid cyclases/Protein prenyltransferase [Clavulina sp. PMI_390]
MQLLVKQHSAHFVRCLRALSSAQVEVDTSRMVLAFYCLAGLDILGRSVFESATKEDERQAWKTWIWRQQIRTPWGTAFRSGPANAVDPSPPPDELTSPYDPPHLIMTFAALLSLAILQDDFSQLDREGLRLFLRKVQQPDGSFPTHPSSGEDDLRATYCAFVICYLLDAWDAIDVRRALAFIESCRAYEGGFGQTPRLESHGGPTFCAAACLSLVPEHLKSTVDSRNKNDSKQQMKHVRLVRWLAQRQVGGFQGRTNKDPDACYSFWCGGALNILGAGALVNAEANAAFLERCQFRFGGIAKAPEETPDPFHTYMALATLSMYPPTKQFGDDYSLARLDVALNATITTAEWAKRHLRAPGVSA